MAKWLWLTLVVAGGWFGHRQWQAPAVTDTRCQKSLYWYLADIDPRFQLTETDALQVIRDAAAHWQQQAPGVFIQERADGFPIRFVYDERQQRQLAMARLSRNVESMDSWLGTRGQSLQHDFEQLNSKMAVFNQQVAQLKQQFAEASRASEQRQLAEQLEAMRDEAQTLNDERDRLLQAQQELNQVVGERNAMVDAAPASQTMEVGQFRQQGHRQSMLIFAYKDQVSLYLTLLHEFGHALGIGHVAEPTAVMHSSLSQLQQGRVEPGLTSVDLAAWQASCTKP